VAIFTGKASTIDEELASIDSDTSVTALAAFTGSNTEQGELPSITGDASMSVSATCDDPETLIMAINYLYTEEGAHLNDYGIEGLSYELNEDDEPRFTDIVMNNANVAQRFALAYYTNPILPGLSDPYALAYSWSTYAQEASDIWRSSYTGHSATFSEDLITLTQAEQSVINTYMTDLDTCCTENLFKFVYGDVEPTEEAFQAFVDDCYNTLHLQDILDIYTAAWLRYLEG
jgi:putative aldouronate transport system substrate-binding protein